MPLKKGTFKKVFLELVNNIASALCFGFLATVMWDLNSPTRDGTHTPCIARQNLNQWTTWEVPYIKVHLLVPFSRHLVTHERSQYEEKTFAKPL